MSADTDTDAATTALPLSQRAMAARGALYLDGLNPAQAEAVETLDGPVLMLAGAGTGKTRALTARIAHLIATGRARPNEVLAVTFTNKAAREMKSRIGNYLGDVVEGMPWVGTFHALCVKILRRHAELLDLKSNFTILDTDDQVRLLKQIIVAENIDEKRWPARMLAHLIDGWKNRAWTPDAVPAAEASAFNHRGSELYDFYQQRLRTLNAVDFGDLLLHVVTIFQKNPDVLEQYRRWFRYILVDEYQDTNVAQYLWLRLLAGGHSNICCVGDDDQSIYGWRGAEVGNILRFEKDFEGARVIRLEQNYRSTPHILAAASGVIAANQGRLGKTLWTEAGEGEKVRLIGHWDGEEEARWIGEEIEALQRGTRGHAPRSLDDMAILVRASHQMRAFEDRFLTIGLPYQVIGGPRFYERMEIRDAMAYFRAAASPDDDLAFERIVNTPKRGLGEKAVAKMVGEARRRGIPLMAAAAQLLEEGVYSGRARAGLSNLLAQFKHWHSLILNESDHRRIAEAMLEDSGYVASYFLPQTDEEVARGDPLRPKDEEAVGRLERLKELIGFLSDFPSLQGFLEHVSLVMDNASDGEEGKVSIMTLHSAKGLEYPIVFLPGWEEGLFPSQRSLDEAPRSGLEEERRLAYVGITRAKEHCYISFVSNRFIFSGSFKGWTSMMPSRFVDELPPDHVEVLTPPGLYGGGYGAASATSTMHDAAARADVYNSPGWQRMAARAGQRGISQPNESRHTIIDLDAVSGWSTGDRVFHQKFGYGEVLSVEGEKLMIDFDKAGRKNVVARFVTGADEVPF